jgi:hypothetical protein
MAPTAPAVNPPASYNTIFALRFICELAIMVKLRKKISSSQFRPGVYANVAQSGFQGRRRQRRVVAADADSQTAARQNLPLSSDCRYKERNPAKNALLRSGPHGSRHR